MGVKIIGKHMDVGESLRTRITERMEDSVSKYFEGGYEGHITIGKSRVGFECDCVIHLDSGVILQAKGHDSDATASFTTAADKLEKRLRRYKSKLKQHHRKRDDVPHIIMEAPAEEDPVPDDYAPVTIAESTQQMQIMSVADAVLSLDMIEEPVVVFKNAASEQINIVYRRSDGNIGWIDPS